MSPITRLALVSAALAALAPSLAIAQSTPTPTHSFTFASPGGAGSFSTGPWSPSTPAGAPSNVLRVKADAFGTLDTTLPALGASTAVTANAVLLDGALASANNFFPGMSAAAVGVQFTGPGFNLVSSGGRNPTLISRSAGLFAIPSVTATGSLTLEQRVETGRVAIGSLAVNAPLTIKGPSLLPGAFGGGTLSNFSIDRLTGTGPVAVRGTSASLGFADPSIGTFTVGYSGSLSLKSRSVGEQSHNIRVEGGVLELQFTTLPSSNVASTSVLTLGSNSSTNIRSNGNYRYSKLERERGGTSVWSYNYFGIDFAGKFDTAPATIGQDPFYGLANAAQVAIVPFLTGAGPGSTTSAGLVALMSAGTPAEGLSIAYTPVLISYADLVREYRERWTAGTQTQQNLAIDNTGFVITAPTTVNAIYVGSGGGISGPSALTVASGHITFGVSSGAYLSVADLVFPGEGFLFSYPANDTPYSLLPITSNLTVGGDLNLASSNKLNFSGTLNIASGINLNDGITALTGEALVITGDRVAIAPGSQLRLQDEAVLRTPLLSFPDPASDFYMTGGTLEAAAVVGSLNVRGGTFSPGNSPNLTTVTGSVVLSPDSTLLMELAGLAEGRYDRLTTTRGLIADGTLNVVLLDGFAPVFGDSFDLFNGPFAGEFGSIILPGLGTGLTWDTSMLYSAGTLTVVPEPAAGAVLAMALPLIARRRRHA